MERQGHRAVPGSHRLNREDDQIVCFRQVSWLVDHSTSRPSRSIQQSKQWLAAFVPTYSGASAADFHRFPYYPGYRAPEAFLFSPP